MRKVLFSIILILVTSSITRAGNFTYGVEWGGSFSAIRYHDYNYLIESGYRMNDSSLSFGGKVNGVFWANVGYLIANRFQISLYSGYEGIDRNVRVVPIVLRGAFFNKGYHSDGLFAFAGGGVGITDVERRSVILGRIGAGYRIVLSKATCLDFMISANMSIRNPDLLDPDSHMPIADYRISVNNLCLGKLGLSMALSF